MVGPVFAQSLEHPRGDGHFTGLVDLGLADVDDEPLAFDVLGPDADGFIQAQSTLIDEGAVGTEAYLTEAAQEPVDFLACEDFGQGLVAFDVDLLPDVPVDRQVVAVKGAQRADRLVDGAGSQIALILEMDEEVEDTLGPQGRQVDARVVVGELVDPAVVGLASALGETFELDKASVVLIPSS